MPLSDDSCSGCAQIYHLKDISGQAADSRALRGKCIQVFCSYLIAVDNSFGRETLGSRKATPQIPC